MKEEALALVRGMSDSGQALNQLREYLQAFVLRSLHESEAFRPLAFVGGTALRFLHNLPRFSEDLDFSLVSAEGYDGREWMAKVKRDLTLAGFNPEVTWNDRKIVHTGWVRVSDLLHDAGLSAMSAEKLAIKVEIDTRPPAGARCERRVVTRHVTFLLQYYDPPSLLAGKLHAAITRKYSKGRDWYDLVWYLSQRPPLIPNLTLLQNALDQTQGAGRYYAPDWRERVRERLLALDFQAIADDVSPFLERPQDAALLTRDNLDGLLGSSGQ
ncbi:nucleotidyl transferase AbiEii/AbiGii toxin family protein [Oligosphaera ethanolica]|uniref:Nucleotidyltransferase component of viral defense system n=1 Tax=Oligosphaera ethanolica TaxID=760260 RepID=A0AAE4APH2_9BACT|nr:nucleotidyl transferase AbiEii/AbiGii toxin family protein [Oligosphaera ethanolica]MDQ0290530.1 putative nucleotidyltransferase component of viral defense system [Oligosphaera ethanolica]